MDLTKIVSTLLPEDLLSENDRIAGKTLDQAKMIRLSSIALELERGENLSELDATLLMLGTEYIQKSEQLRELLVDKGLITLNDGGFQLAAKAKEFFLSNQEALKDFEIDFGS